MEPVQTPEINTSSPLSVPSSPEGRKRTGKKWMLIIAVVTGILIVAAGIFFYSPKEKTAVQEASPVIRDNPTTIVPQPSSTPAPTVSAELQKAIDEAKNSAKEYDAWQEDRLTSYPWLRKLPFAKENYYIYFDINKKVFIGRLYPKSGENIEDLKTLILQEFKTKGIPTDTYTFEWSVNPK